MFINLDYKDPVRKDFGFGARLKPRKRPDTAAPKPPTSAKRGGKRHRSRPTPTPRPAPPVTSYLAPLTEFVSTTSSPVVRPVIRDPVTRHKNGYTVKFTIEGLKRRRPESASLVHEGAKLSDGGRPGGQYSGPRNHTRHYDNGRYRAEFQTKGPYWDDQRSHADGTADHDESGRPRYSPGFIRAGKLWGSVPGTTGLDYPNLTQVPLTRFTCKHQYRTGGYYADVEAGCQVRREP
ncbi:hypothetical protein FJT64_001478 [Amphibalanus amphitrite]|uniref:Uncharacterized protein n=1 Tax=Amphibalanus amphitrite TaxID=1232801 RepID=A0A6A4UU23_AMPAM|nr:hypothetical protein FJT64_001478 [Amphibalanus amphitrite]